MEFVLDVFDSETPLRLDLEEFYDNTTTALKSFPSEFHQAVMNHLVYTTEGGLEDDFEPVVYSSVLDVDNTPDYIGVDVYEGSADGWLKLGKQFEAILDYNAGLHPSQSDNIRGLLAFISDAGWEWAEISRRGIRDAMLGFRGIFDSKWEALQDIIENDHEIDVCIPDWLVFDEDSSADAAEDMGLFTSVEVGHWSVAVWR